MNLNMTKAPFGIRPPVSKPIPEFLIEVGEEGIRGMISKHYDALRVSSISNLFPQDDNDFAQAKVNSADFFIQICGGRAYFNENRGAPQMIGRHAPFRIDANAREIWLELYKPLILELKDSGVTETSLNSFWGYIDIFSIWMINTK